MPHWHVGDITEAVATGLGAQAAADDLEQAVYSIDALDELRLHPIIADALQAVGYGVHPEQRFPSDRSKRRRSEGQRCDLVLTPDGKPLTDPEAEQTLFAPADAVGLESAYWLEIKTVSQFTTEGPFGGYGGALGSGVSRDLKKLAGDRLIFHAGLMVVLFTESREVAEHDLQVWYDRCVTKGYPIAPTQPVGFPINDRLGNAWCAVTTAPVRRL